MFSSLQNAYDTIYLTLPKVSRLLRRDVTANHTRPFFPPLQRKTEKSGLAARDKVSTTL